MNEILYQVVAIDSDLIKDCPDKVTFISQREDMSDGILYNDYDFKNHRYIKTYVSNNFNIYDRLEEKDKQLDKYKNVIDKIKEYCKDKIQEQKEMIDFSKYYLENYDKAISETNSSHSGILLETIKSTTIKRYEAILELMEEVE